MLRQGVVSSAFEALTILASLFLMRVPHARGFGPFTRIDAALSGVVLIGLGSMTLFAVQPTGCRHGPDPAALEKPESDAMGEALGEHDEDVADEASHGSKEGDSDHGHEEPAC